MRICDRAELLAIDRAEKAFRADMRTCSRHSGSQRTTAVYMSTLQPGDIGVG